MISTNEFRRGTKIKLRGEPYEVVDFQHVKIGRGGAFVRAKIRNLKSASITEETFKADEKIETPDLEEKNMQYLYSQGELYYFMDTENFEQFILTPEQLGNSRKFLKENMVVKILYHEDSPIAVELPIFVELKIIKTDPGIRGDTASGGSKPAILESGLIIKVPLHLNEGDVVKVDTRTSEYIERVK
ncbi:MAG TPA: elongation factor P [Nitrospiraceae bacterium]|nr:elongation factor P [Nitrospiraceae bacterium]